MQVPQSFPRPERRLPSEARAGKGRSSWADRVATVSIVAIMLGLSGFGVLRAKEVPLMPAHAFNAATPLALRRGRYRRRGAPRSRAPATEARIGRVISRPGARDRGDRRRLPDRGPTAKAHEAAPDRPRRRDHGG